jgi:hypothetical protein
MMSNVQKPKPFKCTQQATVVIEYAGIAALMWWGGKGGKAERAEMWLVDVGATSYGKGRRAPHFASVMVNATSFVDAPRPDAITTLPGVDAEHAIWHLSSSCVVTLESDLTKQAFAPTFSVLPDSELTKLPRFPKSLNLAWLPEITSLASANSLSNRLPLSAIVKNLRGRVDAQLTPFTEAYSYTFKENKQPIGPADRVVIGRIRQTLKYKKKFEIHLTRPKRTITITHNRTDPQCNPTFVVISNLCLCGDRGPGDHFFSYYDLLSKPLRRPRPEHKPRGGANPFIDPENCFQSVFRFS